MSTGVLHTAALRMRARAKAATQGGWDGAAIGSEGYYIRAANPDSPIRRLVVARCTHEKWETDRGNAEHIASWPPPVALAVADWLDYIAADGHDGDGPGGCADCAPALTVARAYLGSDQ